MTRRVMPGRYANCDTAAGSSRFSAPDRSFKAPQGAAVRSIADRRSQSQHERIFWKSRCARRSCGRSIVVERGIPSGMVSLPLARACRRRPRGYSRRGNRDRRSDLDELASAGAERLAALASCHMPVGVALPVSLHRCRGRRRTARARSPLAFTSGICRLPNPSFSRDAS